MGGTGALGGAGSAGSVLSGAGGLSSGAGGIAGATGATGAQTLAAASPEIAANLAAAGNTGILSGTSGLAPTAAGSSAALPTTATTLPPAGGTPFTPPVTPPATPLPPAGGTPPIPPELAAAKENAARELAARGGPPKGSAAQKGIAQSDFPVPEYLKKGYEIVPEAMPEVATGADAVKAAQASSQQVAQFTPEVPAGIGAKLPTNPLLEGVKMGLDLVKKNPLETGLGLMSVGQYMNQPEEEDEGKYKNKVDMSGFKASVPQQRPFTRSYEYQSYAVGGPVEQMAAMNAVGANTGYPMANLQTPMYSNPAVQRPEAVNVVAPSAGAGVGAYSGEQRFAEGGLSAAERREYGLQTRGQRASRGLSKSYEEMEEARQKEAMKLFNERPDPGIIPRSRTQQMSSPFSAAQAEHARLGKKAKVPVVEMPKTNLGDIDNYMDIPIEAAGGGIMHGLGGYSDGGRLLKGPGDGVSDSIPAVIGRRQPARLADGEFVVPARIVSELGNGSTEAGARKLYAMMERVQASRKKSIGKKKVAVNSKSDKHLPA